MGDSKRDRTRWPLSFQMGLTGHRFWSHTLYRGLQDQPVRVLYSRTKLESEEIAHEFLGEKVIGFDMEWPFEKNTTGDTPLQQRIGLIQIACEDKIALFHIGLHSGSTAKDLLAPALRNIIEDPAIAKCGVAVLNADFSRLQQWFGLKPRGAFELSHLHNLVSFGASNPAQCTTRLRKLSEQVEQHLGLPLHKGKVRTSNWSQPLNKDQVKYAAADAYAGFMLFHCMNAKRLDMVPPPPLPVYAETYGHAVAAHSSSKPLLQLLPAHGDVEPTSVLDFYKPPGDVVEDHPDVPSAHKQAADNKKAVLPPKGTGGLVRTGRRGKHILFTESADVGADVGQQLRDQHAAEQQQRKDAPDGTSPPVMAAAKSSTSLKAKTAGSTVAFGVLDETRTELLFRELRKHRRDLAKERECAPFIIARDALLHAMSRECPRSDVELLGIHGIGKKKFADYGSARLAIVRNFVEASSIDDTRQARGDRPQLPLAVLAASPPRMAASDVRLDQPIRSTPALHTGISFGMQNATLGREKEGEGNENELDDQDTSDDSSAFGSPLRRSSPSVLKRKREKLESELETDSARRGQLQRTYSVPPETEEQRREPSPAATTMQPPQILTTPDQRDTDLATVLLQTSRINHDGMLAAQESTEAISLSLPPATPHKTDPPHHPTAKPDVNASKVPEKILRNRILAFNKLVATTVQLPADTVDHLVNKVPETIQELLQVPGIMPFANACSRANHDLLGFLVKSASATR